MPDVMCPSCRGRAMIHLSAAGWVPCYRCDATGEVDAETLTNRELLDEGREIRAQERLDERRGK